MKRTARLLFMILLLVILVSMCLVIRSCDREEPQQEEQQIVYDASDIDGASVSSLTVENENGSFSFELQGNGWVMSEAPALEIQTDIVSQLAQNMTDITGTNRIENVTDLAQYGLDEPSVKVSITDKNGEETYRFGALNGLIDAYYFCSEQNPTYVFTVESSVCDSFTFDISELLILDFPQPPEADVIKSVELKQGEESVIYTAVSEFLYNDEEQVTEDNPNGAVYSHSATLTEGGKTQDFGYADMYRLCEAVAAIEPSGDYFYSEEDNGKYFSDCTELNVTYTVKTALEADNAAGGYVESEEIFTVYISSDDEGALYAKPDADSPLIYKLTDGALWEFAK